MTSFATSPTWRTFCSDQIFLKLRGVFLVAVVAAVIAVAAAAVVNVVVAVVVAMSIEIDRSD